MAHRTRVPDSWIRMRRAPAESAGESLPRGMQLAGAWSWRILAVFGVLAVLGFLIIELRYLVIPLMVGVLLAALLVPFCSWLQRHGWPKWAAVAAAELGLIAVVAGLVWLVVVQVIAGFGDLQRKAAERFDDLIAWLVASPLNLTEAEINDSVASLWENLQRDSQALLSGAASIGSTAGHFLAGFVIALFATLFMLIDGRGIWNWIVRLFPRRAQRAVNGGGEAGWLTLTNFVKVQVLVAAIDAVGIGLGAVILQLPMAIPIAVAVFLGSFVPIVGAIVSGALAVLVALIVYDIWVALIMLGIVLLVQQIESHVLQPLVMGSAVKVHPLAVVLAVAGGGMVAGIPGTLFAVPVVASLNAIVRYIASGTWRTKPHPTLKDVVTDA